MIWLILRLYGLWKFVCVFVISDRLGVFDSVEFGYLLVGLVVWKLFLLFVSFGF